MKRLFGLSCYFYLLIGITSVLLGSLLPKLLPYYGRQYSDGGLLLFLQFAGFLCGVMTSPWWSSRYGRKQLLLLALLTIVIPYAVIGFLPGWYVVVAMTFFTGFGSGIIESAIGAFTIEFAEDRKSIAMTKLDVYFGVGALLMPAAVSGLVALDAWSYSFFAGAAAAGGLLVLWVSMPAECTQLLRTPPAADGTAEEHAGAPARPGKYQGSQKTILLIYVIFFFVYMGLELGLMNFLPSILVEGTGVSASTGALGVTFFWIAMVIGRLFAGHLAERVRYVPFLAASSLGTLLLLIGLALVEGRAAIFLLILAVGLFMSGLFSIALVLANELLPGMVERTTSILIASGGIGGSVLQLFVGWSMTSWEVGGTLWILAAFALVLFAAVLLSTGLRGNRASTEKTELQVSNR
ncbi:MULTISPECIES: MFS transporter [Paenibacillus]|uniref:MFS transporter n=1 Tax=Paenibacillus TaxID=44249 RepID=UPI0022B8761A|nr:MFS transporter [Paenibacillus caseinilyticus]MCZ8517878.1 MFS transporter [Paenibacillus caseinilyticus]